MRKTRKRATTDGSLNLAYQPSAEAKVYAVFECGNCGRVYPITVPIVRKNPRQKCPACQKEGKTQMVSNPMTFTQFDGVFASKRKEAANG